MSAYMDYMNSSDELYHFVKSRVEGLGASLVESLSDEEIAILEKANAANMSEEDYMDNIDNVLPEGE